MIPGAENLEAGSYGACPMPGVAPSKMFGRPAKIERRSTSVRHVVAAIFVPLLVFALTYWVMSFWIRYWMPLAAFAIVIAVGLLVCAFFYATYAACNSNGADPQWLGLLSLLSFVAFGVALRFGCVNYHEMMQPYFDLQQLNRYESVNPTTAQGNQYMDFGVIEFLPTARIDREFSMAFKNDDMYCVAPVKLNSTMPGSYDFWAVGKNCCSSHLYDFRCGMWNDPSAHSGVRVMQEKDKSFYQLAARQAAAAFSINVTYPVFFEWITDSRYITERFQDDGWQNFINACLYFFFADVVTVIIALFAFSKL